MPRTYRLLEFLPGMAIWLTLIGVVLLSWLAPAQIAVFIILFDTYFLLKTIYLLLHLRITFGRMRENLATDWEKKLEELDARNSALVTSPIFHLVVLPMYKEPISVVSESFESLLRTTYPKEKLLVVLALEERGGKIAQEVGSAINQKYGDKFGGFLTTTHPMDLPGEIPGKGSNETWAVAEAVQKLI